MKRALVLAGRGVAGIAWELGVLRGLQDADPAVFGDGEASPDCHGYFGPLVPVAAGPAEPTVTA